MPTRRLYHTCRAFNIALILRLMDIFKKFLVGKFYFVITKTRIVFFKSIYLAFALT